MTPAVYSKRRKHPSDAIYVGRPSLFGNPFTVEEHGHGTAIERYREWIMLPEQAHIREKARDVLRGQNLLCWCAPKPCHADILLEIANS